MQQNQTTIWGTIRVQPEETEPRMKIEKCEACKDRNAMVDSDLCYWCSDEHKKTPFNQRAEVVAVRKVNESFVCQDRTPYRFGGQQ